MNATRVPAREALVFGDRRLTWAQLDQEVERFAAALCVLGLGKGDRCALMAPNSDGFVIAYYAALRLGAIVVPVNTRLATPDIVHVLRDSGSSILVFDPDLAGKVD